MQNDLYLSIIHRPVAGLAAGVIAKALSRTRGEPLHGDLVEALDACDKLVQTLSASLVRYEPELLGCYRHEETCAPPCWNSWAAHQWGVARMPLQRISLNRMLTSVRILFGSEAIEYRSATDTRVGAMLGIKEYPTPTTVGMYNSLFVRTVFLLC